MRFIGPLWNISCVRMEAKHKILKTISRGPCSRVNICRSIAIKHQLVICDRFSKKETNTPQFTFTGKRKFCSSEIDPKIKCLSNFSDFTTGKYHSCTSITYTGENISGNSVIVQMYEDNLDFHSVKMLLTDECAKNCTLIVKKFNDVFLSEPLRSYKIHDLRTFLT